MSANLYTCTIGLGRNGGWVGRGRGSCLDAVNVLKAGVCVCGGRRRALIYVTMYMCIYECLCMCVRVYSVSVCTHVCTWVNAGV